MLSPDFLFPRFLVFPPANPSNFSIQILSTQYRSIILYVQMKCEVERQEAVEVQDDKIQDCIIAVMLTSQY